MKKRLLGAIAVALMITGATSAQNTPKQVDPPAQKDIVGGQTVSISEYPYQISLQTTSGSHFCGGSIIDDEWIVTANHCVDGQSAGNMRIRAGSTAKNSGGQIRSVAQIIMYPGYVTTSQGKDIALLRLSTPLDLTDANVSAIQWVRSSDAAAGLTDAGVNTVTSGWGTLSSGGSSPTNLQAVDVPIVSNADADAAYPENITSDQLAAGLLGVGGKDACQGDSGGPLVVKNSAGTGVLLAGVTSWGYGCADAQYPGMYARVSSFDSWLASYVAYPSTTAAVPSLFDAVGSYCASQGTNVSDEYISRVRLNSIDNTTGANGGYGDFTSISTSLSKGTAYTVTVNPTWTGTVYSEGYAVWIDYNQDGDFNDAGEQVFTQAATQNTQVSGSFTVPASATDGDTRMRVSMKYNGVPTSCETFTYGEVEDYTVTIGGGSATCGNVTGLNSSNVTADAFTMNWSAVAGANDYTVQLRVGSTGTWSDYTATSNTISFSGASASTQYQVRVRANCTGATGNYSSIVSVTTLAGTVTYCASQGNNTSDEFINRVRFNTIDNTSGNNGGYADYTSVSTTVVRGNSYTVTINPTWTGTVYREAYNVWIDFNKDGDFDDAGEAVYSRSRTTSSQVSGTVSIPTSALTGATRMRVSMKYNANATSCETFTYGEVEDYTINITAGNSLRTVATADVDVDMDVYPNPVMGNQTTVQFSLGNNMSDVNLQVLDMSGRTMMQQNFTAVSGSMAHTLDFTNFERGIYMIHLSGEGFNEVKKVIVK